MRCVLAVLLALGLLSGCTSSPPGPEPGWRPAALPAGVQPSAVTAYGDRVLVGGSSGPSDTQRPRLLVHRGSRWRDVPLHARSAYGEQAALVQVSATADRIVAIGTKTGGAHLNPRWSVWVGSWTGLTEQPQGTETFGGPSAGSLTGVLAEPATVVGTWSISNAQVGVATWVPAGTVWSRTPVPAVVTGDVGTQTSPSAIAARPGGVLVSGLTLTADPAAIGGVDQRPVVWVDSAAGWQRVDLPGAKADGSATGVACGTSGCWVAGWSGFSLAVWTLSASGTTAALDRNLLQVPIARYVSHALVAVAGESVAVAVNAVGDDDALSATRLLLRKHDGSWALLGTVQDSPVQLAVDPDAVYLLGRSGLYVHAR